MILLQVNDSVAMLLATHTPIHAYLDCSSAIRRATQALFPLGAAVCYLQHGSLSWTYPQTTPPHQPHSESAWTDNDRGIHTADAIAGTDDGNTLGLHTYFCDADQIHDAITPPGTWRWQDGDSPSMALSENGLNDTNFFNTAGREIWSKFITMLLPDGHDTVRL